jgi:hypothetical protein
MSSMRVSDSATQIENLFTPRVIRLMQQAVSDAVSEHHRLGYAVVVERDGQRLWLMPDGSTRPRTPGEPPPDRQ